MAFHPWDAATTAGSGSRPAVDKPRGESDGDLPDRLLAIYQRSLRRPARPGWGCRLRPSCSAFARQALQKWRAAGLILVADRLFVREHALMDRSYLPACAIAANDDEGLLDPVP